jgi:MFS family permease
VAVGLLLSTAVFAQFSRLPEAQFLTWGWRVPFLLSAVLVVIGFAIRSRIVETPAFAAAQASGTVTRQPLLEVVRRYPREVLVAMGARLAENGSFYIYTVFLLVYGTQKVGLSREMVLDAVLVASACEIVAIPFYGALSDRVGRRPVYLFGAIMTLLLALPVFVLFDTGSPALVLLAVSLGILLAHAPMYGPQAAFFAELFGTHVRYSGASIGAQLSSVIAGGLSPFIATALLPFGRGALAGYIAVMAVITIVSVLVAAETATRSLDEEGGR